jgi:hypothetical protein
MIGSNELRIGNLINLKNRNGIFVFPVTGIIEQGVFINHNNGEWRLSYHEVDPVLLTEEAISKCGFKEVGFYDNVYYLDDFRIYLDKKADYGLLKYEKETENIEIEIDSIHKLQNVYFALTGKELEVDL